jgi:hypothetical protein
MALSREGIGQARANSSTSDDDDLHSLIPPRSEEFCNIFPPSKEKFPFLGRLGLDW